MLFGPAPEWTTTDYLLALVFDALNIANWQRARSKKVPRPKPLPRPGDRSAEHRRTGLTPHQIETRLRRLQRRDEQRRRR